MGFLKDDATIDYLQGFITCQVVQDFFHQQYDSHKPPTKTETQPIGKSDIV